MTQTPPPTAISDLLPCPFCGSADIEADGWSNSEGVTGPACNSCGASAGTVSKAPEDNIAAWNRRSFDGAEAVLRKALEGVRANLIRLAWEENSVMIEGIDKALASRTRNTETVPTAAMASSDVRWHILRVAFEEAQYQPGDHPVVPVRVAEFMKRVGILLASPPSPAEVTARTVYVAVDHTGCIHSDEDMERVIAIAKANEASVKRSPPAQEAVTFQDRVKLLAEVISLIEDDMYGPGEAEGVEPREAFNKALRRQINRITSRLIVAPTAALQLGKEG